MKKNIKIYENGEYKEKEINYIPIRYIIAILLAVLEISAIIAILIVLAIYVPYFYIAIYLTVIAIVIKIIGTDENPDYKIPWIVVVIVVPIIGMMLYFMFSKRTLPNKIIKRLNKIKEPLNKNNQESFKKLKSSSKLLYTQAINLCNISNSNLYQNNKIKYYRLGELMYLDMIEELKKAKDFIFLEYFIIEEGKFWNSILEILKEKASNNILVKVIYDDIGCMMTLSGAYYKELRKFNIQAIPFSKLKGTADGEFNNRSHRKILVIDGKVAFTGGVNIADEYINEKTKYGHWKDGGIKIEGESVDELTRLFLIDYYLNQRKEKVIDFNKYYNKSISYNTNNFLIPFGDGPKPIYEKNVSKIAIMNLINHATDYVYITTPYLIIDNEMMRCIENAALRGVDVRIVIPHIPDKKIVFELTKSKCEILKKSNVKIYEYSLGFIHSKIYIADGCVGIIGTSNLDYRSLVHHFENGVWIYDKELIKQVKDDFLEMFETSEIMEIKKRNIFVRLFRAILNLFAPLL